MADEHPLGDLAPRDVVARAISRRLNERGLDHLWHDATSNGGFRRIERDLGSGATQLIFDWDCGGRSRLANGIEYEDTSVATYSIYEDDPLSANVRVENTSFYGRGDLQVSITAIGTMTCTATDFLVTSELEVHEGASRVFARTWTHEFPRDHG